MEPQHQMTCFRVISGLMFTGLGWGSIRPPPEVRGPSSRVFLGLLRNPGFSPGTVAPVPQSDCDRRSLPAIWTLEQPHFLIFVELMFSSSGGKA